MVTAICNLKIYAQDKSSIDIPFLHSAGYLLTDNLFYHQQTLGARNAFVAGATAYFKNNMFLKATGSSSRPFVLQPVTILKETYEPGDRLMITSIALYPGYNWDLGKHIYLGLYTGIFADEIYLPERKKYRSKIGFPLGSTIQCRFDVSKNKKLFLVFYTDNSINYSRMFKISDSFSKWYYSAEFGAGLCYLPADGRKWYKEKIVD